MYISKLSKLSGVWQRQNYPPESEEKFVIISMRVQLSWPMISFSIRVYTICGKSVSLTGRLITLVKKSNMFSFLKNISIIYVLVGTYLPMQELNYFIFEKSDVSQFRIQCCRGHLQLTNVFPPFPRLVFLYSQYNTNLMLGMKKGV